MGTATLWKIIMLAWSYENELAIPAKDEKRAITGGLSRLLNVGYSKNIVKFDYASLYPSIQLVYDVFPECDVMGVQKSMLKYFRNIRIKYKRLAGELAKTNPVEAEMYDRKQLPIKIFINAYFGSLSAPQVFPWGDMNMGETITCTGRQCLRMMIMFFEKKGYVPLVMDTDGVNFSTPEDIDTHIYIGKGLNELVEKGKEYKGIEADTAEFNDIFMRNEMGLDIDYTAPACINVSRKNYIIKLLKKGKEKIKLTGNTIKSKKLQQYIVEFLDEGLKQKDFTSDELSQAAKLMGRAQKATKEKFAQSSSEKQNLIIDGTGGASKPLLKKKQELEDLGYECMMVMLYVSPLTSLQRNAERDRSLMPSIVLRTWRDVNQNINVYRQAFGDKFVLINNDPKDANKGFSLELIKPYIEASKAAGKPKSPEEQAKSEAEKQKLNADIEALVKELPEFDTLESAKSKINEFVS